MIILQDHGFFTTLGPGVRLATRLGKPHSLLRSSLSWQPHLLVMGGGRRHQHFCSCNTIRDNTSFASPPTFWRGDTEGCADEAMFCLFSKENTYTQLTSHSHVTRFPVKTDRSKLRSRRALFKLINKC